MPEESDLVSREEEFSSGEANQLLASTGPSAKEISGLLQESRVQRFAEGASGLGEMVKQGFTLGLADEAGALGAVSGDYIAAQIQGKPFDLDESWSRGIEAQRQKFKPFQEENPGVSLTTEVVGGVVSGLPKLASTATASIARMIMTGSLSGSVAGFGTSEGGTIERLMGAGSGAAMGGLGSALFGSVLRGITAVGRRKLTKTERMAFNNLIQAFDQDGVPIDDAVMRLAAWQRAGSKPEVLADLGGDNVRGLLRAAVAVPGEARTRAGMVIGKRAAEQGERVLQDLMEAAGTGRGVREIGSQLQKLRKAASDPLYELARSEPLRLQGDRFNINDLMEILNRPSMKEAWRKAQKNAKDLGKALPEMFHVGGPKSGQIVEIPDLEMLDWMKRMGLDAIIEKHRNPMTGRLDLKDPKVRTLQALKRQFLEVVDDLSPDYKAARAAYAGPSELLDALDTGKRFLNDFKRDPFMTEDVFTRMGPSEREYFRIGLAQAIENIIENAPSTADAVKKITGTTRLKEAMALVMPDEVSLAQFQRAMEREANMFRTNTFGNVQAGSRTAVLTEEVNSLMTDMGLSPGAALHAAATGDPTTLVGHIIARVSRLTANSLKTDIAEAIGEILLAGDPAEIARLLSRLDSVAASQAGLAAAEAAAAKGVGVLAPNALESIEAGP